MRTFVTLWGSSGKGPLFLLAVIIALSAYTHMWNPAGFPTLQGDETIYVKRGEGILNHEVLHGSHDHPFFGQMVLAGFMHVSGYQDLLDDPSTDTSHLKKFYAYPRAFMGLLAVLDTLLVYLIADKMFGRRVAAVSAVVFAVAPMSLMLRMVLLDSILLPFVLSSVLLALHSRSSVARRHALLIASGVCLGLAIFTKIPAVVMIPPCALLAYSASRKIRDVGLWFTPVVAISAIWPAYAAQAGQFDAWIRDVAYQAGRSNGGLLEATRQLFGYDPILVSLGIAGFAFAAACLILRLGRVRGAVRSGEWHKGRDRGGGSSHDPSQVSHRALGRDRGPGTAELRDLGFLAAWFSSILLLFGAIGLVKVYHLSMLLPALCVGAAVLILWGGGRLTHDAGGRTQDRTAMIAVTVIGLAGLLTTGVIVHFDVQSPEFEAASFLLKNYSDEPDTVKIVSFTSYWLLGNVYGMQNTASFHAGSPSYCLPHIPHVHGLQNTTGFFPCKNPVLGLGMTNFTVRDATGFSDHYMQPDAEGAVLVLKNHDEKFFADVAEACDYTTDSASMYCHNAYSVTRLHNDSSMIKEFWSEVPIDVSSLLPPSVERYLTSQYKIMEWIPAK